MGHLYAVEAIHKRCRNWKPLNIFRRLPDARAFLVTETRFRADLYRFVRIAVYPIPKRPPTLGTYKTSEWVGVPTPLQYREKKPWWGGP